MRHLSFTVTAHCSLRSPLSLCNPTLLSGLRSRNDLTAVSASSKSMATAKSNPRNRLGRPPSHTWRGAALRHDRIMAKTYYVLQVHAIVICFRTPLAWSGDAIVEADAWA